MLAVPDDCSFMGAAAVAVRQLVARVVGKQSPRRPIFASRDCSSYLEAALSSPC